MEKEKILVVIDQISISTGGFWTIIDIAKILEEDYNVNLLVIGFNYTSSLNYLSKTLISYSMKASIFYFPVSHENKTYKNFFKFLYDYLFNYKLIIKDKILKNHIIKTDKFFLSSLINLKAINYLLKNKKNESLIYQNHAGSISVMSKHLSSLDPLKRENLYNNYIKKVDKVFFQSESHMHKFNLINEENSKKSFSFIPSINESSLQKSKQEIPLEFSSCNFNIVYVASIQDRKQQIFCVDILNELIQISNSFHIYLIGKTSNYDYLNLLNEEIVRRELHENIHILGYREDYANFMWHSDLVIHPSKDEGVSRVLREALYMNKCIIASNIDGSIDLLKNHDAGILLDTNSHRKWSSTISEIFSNKELRLAYENKAGMSYHEQLSESVYKKNIKKAFN